MDTDSTKEASVHGNEKPEVSARDRSEFVVGSDGTLTTECGLEIDPMPHNPPDITCGGLPGRLFLPTEDPAFSRAFPQSWLDGQTTLHQAGQCIGAELEIAMLCMQKRLGKVCTVKYKFQARCPARVGGGNGNAKHVIS